MNTLQFLSQSVSDLQAMNLSDLKKSVKQAANALNKRYQNVKYNRNASQRAVKYVERTGGRFSVRGKDKNALIREVKRMQNFNRNKASRVSDAIREQKQIETKLFGKTAKDIARERGLTGKQARDYIQSVSKKISDLWDAYHNYQEINQLQSSTSLIQEVQDTAKRGIDAPEDIDDLIAYLESNTIIPEDEEIHMSAGWDSNIWRGNR